jgi:hypothetical protein
MKKQIHIQPLLLRSLLGAGLFLCLSACPSSPEPLPPGPSLSPVSEFPQQHISCCWQDLQKTDSSYAQLAKDALNGNLEATASLLLLSRKFELAQSYAHGAVLAEVMSRLGDDYFAKVLSYLEQKGELKNQNAKLHEPLAETLRNLLEGGFSLNRDSKIQQLHLAAFPESAKLLAYATHSEQK